MKNLTKLTAENILTENGDLTKAAKERLYYVGKECLNFFGEKYTNKFVEDADGIIFFGTKHNEKTSLRVSWEELAKEYNYVTDLA